jgi:murein DD-endopeptidase MepM/ murein hydrolase activator NlpD
VARTGRIAALFVLAALAVLVATAMAAGGSGRPATASAVAFARQDPDGTQQDLVAAKNDADHSGSETRATASTPAGRGRASASAAVEKVDVFDGLVTADEVRVHAEATGDGTSTSGAITGLAIEGTPQTAPDGRTLYSLHGYGQMVALDSGSTGIAGLRVRLIKDYKGNKAGSVVTVGYASATARDAVAPVTPKAAHAHAAPAKKKKAKHKATPAPKKRHHKAPQLSAKQKLANALSQQERDWAAALLLRPGYAFPVAGTHNYVDTFGAPRSDVPVHVGNDIFAAFGTPIVAVADGRIYRVGTLKISGNRLWLRDKKGYRYFYCHLSDFAAAAYNGADVHAGEVIGFVGNTGDAEPTPPHLHFEVHMPDGTVTDPYPYLQKWDQSGVTSASWLRRYGKDPGVRPGALVVVKDFLAEG